MDIGTQIQGRCHICHVPHVQVLQVSTYSDSMNVCEQCIDQMSRFEDLCLKSTEIKFRSLFEFCEYLSEADQILCRGIIKHPDLTRSAYTIEAKEGQIRIHCNDEIIDLVHFDSIYDALDAQKDSPISSRVSSQTYIFLEKEYNKYRQDPTNYNKRKLGQDVLDWGQISASDLIQMQDD
jgi:hypothetical protein